MALLTIDGIEVTAADEVTILEAAKQAGIWIPTLCYYPKITPSDSCRLCVVEIEGVDRPMTSCNTMAVEGMRVRTDTDRLRLMREEVMKLILMDHPLDCPTCPAGGECEIQNLTYKLGIYGTDFPIELRSVPVVGNWPLIEYNQNLCISCLRCVKVCHEVVGASAITSKGKGYDARIDTVDGGPLNCDFCGECVEACPSGAMSNKVVKRWARSWELRKTPTVCPLCSAGCKMEINVKDGSAFRVTTQLETPNHGTLCAGGRFGYDFIHGAERLTSPQLREGGDLRPVSWERAVAFTAEKLSSIISASGPSSVVGLASPRITNEDAYAFQKFFRSVIGCNNIDSEARFSFLRVQRAFELTCGAKGATNTLDELLNTGAMLVIGADPLEETPALGWKIKAAARRHDSNVIVANSRATSLDRFAKIRLRIRPYSETDLTLGLMKSILDQDLWDGKFIRAQTSHFLALKNLLDKISLKGILNRTGLEEEALNEAARLFAEAPDASVIFGGDVILQENGLQCTMNLANLALLTGNMGRPNAGIYPILEKGNLLGLCEMGALPEYLPGFQDTATARHTFESVWRRTLPFSKGLTVPEMVRGLESGDVRAVYIVGADPLTDYPNSGRLAEALAKAELLVVHELFPSPTAKKAHVVFPSASFAEREGTMTNIEHRVQKLEQALPPVGDSRPDWSALEDVARALGKPMGYFSAEDVFREITLTVPAYKGLKFGDLGNEGRLVKSFGGELRTTRTGMPYAFAPVRTIPPPADKSEAEYPFEMLAGRSMFHFGSTSTRSANLMGLCPGGFVEINNEDAGRLDLKEGARVEVRSQDGAFVAQVKLTGDVRKGMVFAPTNFPDMNVYSLFRENTTMCRVKLVPVGD